MSSNLHSDELNVVDDDDDYVQSIEDNSGKFSSSKQLVEDVPAMIGVDGNAHGVVHSVGVEVGNDVLSAVATIQTPKQSQKCVHDPKK